MPKDPIQVLQHGIDQGLHPGAQLFVSHRGETVIHCALGQSRPDRPLQPDSLCFWASATKPLTAVAFAQLVEQNRTHWHDPVAGVIPEFQQGGKENIQFHHLLTHTAGFRSADRLDQTLSWEDAVRATCASPLEPDWVPGETAGYQTHSSWLILGEAIQRLSGQSYPDYMSRHVLQPLGLEDFHFGMPIAEQERRRHQIAPVYRTEQTSAPSARINDPQAIARCQPGSNTWTSAAQFGRFYLALLHLLRAGSPPSSSPLLQPSTLRTLLSRHRRGLFDRTFQHTIDFGYGFLLNSARYGPDTVPYNYGPHASDQAFGHSGAQCAAAFADPPHELVVAWVCTGMPGEKRHQNRARAIHTAIYESLRLP